ncbi:MAG: energy transducer TonB [Saprospiraceae bacterium]
MEFFKIVLISCVWLTAFGQQEEISKEYSDNEYYLFTADQMPIFGTCDLDSLSNQEQKECSDRELLDFIYSNLKCPKIIRCGNYTEKIYTRIYIDEEGSVSDPEFIRPTSEFFELEIERLVQLMPCWIPGKRNGVPIEVSYVIPIQIHMK